MKKQEKGFEIQLSYFPAVTRCPIQTKDGAGIARGNTHPTAYLLSLRF